MAEEVNEQQARVVATFQRVGTVSDTARELGLARSTVYHHLDMAGVNKPLVGGRLNQPKPEVRKLPPKGKVARYICTSAQNNTFLAEDFWHNLQELAARYKAEILVGSFSYNKSAYGPKAVKKGTSKSADFETLWYDERIEELLEKSDKPILLAPDLVWCGEQNILPTADKPLTGLESYTGKRSGIFPHAKMQMQSIANGKGEDTKFNYTTGTVTQRNYIQKKAGLKAEFHHIYGALLVEVNSDGVWWVHQLNADEKGTFFWFDEKVEEAKITKGHRLKAITWGDIHVATIDPVVDEAAWGAGGIVDTYKPEYQFWHDVLDFRSRNGHTIRYRNWLEAFRHWCQGHDNVEHELNDVAIWAAKAARPFCENIVVQSNHDRFFDQWLDREDYKRDFVNRIYFLEADLFRSKAVRADTNKPVNLLRWAVERAWDILKSKPKGTVRFLERDESFVICGSAKGGIECGMHGDEGPNGAPGSADNFRKMGGKANRAHEHSAGIVDGIYTAGLSGKLEQGYNSGPSSWSQSHIFTYQNGKRCIVTMRNGKIRA